MVLADSLEALTPLTSLNLANNNLVDIAALEGLSNLTSLDLTDNNAIACSDLDSLETQLGQGVVTRPATSQQTVVWSGSYEPFGEVEETVNIVENNIRFLGQYEDEETGLHYNYFRDYDPSLGRYVESDPIGLVGGNNVYIYALNDPTSNFDSSGLASIEGWSNVPFFFGFGFGVEMSLVNINCCQNGEEIERVYMSIEAGPSFGFSTRVGPGLGLNASSAGLGSCVPPKKPRFRFDFGPFSGTDANSGLDFGTRTGLAARANVISELRLISSTPTGKCC